MIADNTPDARSRSQSETPSRPALKNLIEDALSSNPDGLRSEDLFKWLKTNRPEALIGRDGETLRASMNSTLSTQSHKKEPTIWKYKDRDSKKPGYVWRLASAESEEGGKETPTGASKEALLDATSVDKIGPALPIPAESGKASLPSDLVVATSARSTAFDEELFDPPSEAGDTVPDTSAAENVIETHDDGVQRTTTDGEDSQRHSLGLEYAPSTEEKDGHAIDGTADANSTVEAANPSLVDQQLYYGKIIMQVQELSRRALRLQKEVDECRADFVEIVILEKNAENLNSKAQELEKVARQAREVAEQATLDLQNSRSKENEIQGKEAEVRQVHQDLAESRAKLKID